MLFRFAVRSMLRGVRTANRNPALIKTYRTSKCRCKYPHSSRASAQNCAKRETRRRLEAVKARNRMR
jgi:hypothetical protein